MRKLFKKTVYDSTRNEMLRKLNNPTEPSRKFKFKFRLQISSKTTMQRMEKIKSKIE
uniref:Uncharacterized protein n=1 Tax=Romanomermis culicivorax TaxID=13658 RepID=A0A915L0J9_ROMCU